VSDRIDLDKLAIVSSGNNEKKPSHGGQKLAPDILSPDMFRVKNKKGQAYLALIFDCLRFFLPSIHSLLYSNGNSYI